MHDTTLLQLIEDDIAPANQLIELLKVESTALHGRDMPLLENILAGKQSLIIQLEQRGRKRSQVLLSAGFTPDHDGFTQMAAQSGVRDRMLESSERLNRCLAECRQVNETNGQLIRLQQRTTANQISILTGGEAPSLYNARGSTSRLANQRPLSQA